MWAEGRNWQTEQAHKVVFTYDRTKRTPKNLIVLKNCKYCDYDDSVIAVMYISVMV
jgi:hypothetical protein